MLQVLDEVKRAGYDGFECGINSLEYIEKTDLQRIGLTLHAAHTGLDFAHCDDLVAMAESHRPLIERSHELGTQFIFISGMGFMGKNQADYQREAEGHNLLGRLTAQYGMRLCFHNHHWEFKKSALGFRTYFATWDPAYVFLVPDLGWVVRADVDPVVFLAEHKAQVKSLHFKDFTFDDHFTELGRGIVDFPRIYRYVQDMEDLWFVAEQDACAGNPTASITENAQYLAKLKES